ncbi:MAG: cobalt ECF transporter T component CbiQ [Candidatus Bathyarchaeia archaeon]
MPVLSELVKAAGDLVFLERFQSAGGILQRIDPRIKLISLTTLVVVAVSLKTIAPLSILFIMILLLATASKTPIRFFLYRATFFIPIFAGVISLPLPFITPGAKLLSVSCIGYSLAVTNEGVYRAILFTFRVWVCVAAMTLLIMTTRFSAIISAMERLKFPKIFTLMLAITYRYIHVFIDETHRMLLAMDSRSAGKMNRLQALKALAHTTEALFIRAYERGERVYGAMVARGYTGDARYIGEVRCSLQDWAFGVLSASVFIGAAIVQLYAGGV